MVSAWRGFLHLQNAAKLIKNTQLASAAERERNADAGKAKNQHVFFSNPCDSSSEDALKSLCAEAGLTFAGLNANQRDLRCWSTLKNAGMEIGKTALQSVAGGAGIGAAASGAAGAESVQKAAENGINALISGNYFMAAACVGGALLIGQGIYKKLTPIGTSLKCTFGNGNERWYTNDKALIKKLKAPGKY